MVLTDNETYLKKFEQKQEDAYSYRLREIKKKHSGLLYVVIYQTKLNSVSQLYVSGLADPT